VETSGGDKGKKLDQVEETTEKSLTQVEISLWWRTTIDNKQRPNALKWKTKQYFQHLNK